MWSYILWNTIILCILTSANSHNTHLNILRLSPQLPGICPFQKLNYTITIQQISPTHNTLSNAGRADNIIVIGPKTVVGRTNVNEVVNSNLVVDTMYSVLVDFALWLGMHLQTLPLVSKSVCVLKAYVYIGEAYKNSDLNFQIQMTNWILGCRNCPAGKAMIGQLTMDVSIIFFSRN